MLFDEKSSRWIGLSYVKITSDYQIKLLNQKKKVK